MCRVSAEEGAESQSTHIEVVVIKGYARRKARKVAGLMFVSKELFKFLIGLEKVQFIFSLSVVIPQAWEELQC